MPAMTMEEIVKALVDSEAARLLLLRGIPIEWSDYLEDPYGIVPCQNVPADGIVRAEIEVAEPRPIIVGSKGE